MRGSLREQWRGRPDSRASLDHQDIGGGIQDTEKREVRDDLFIWNAKLGGSRKEESY